MKMLRILFLVAAAAWVGACGSIDVKPGGNPDRVLSGTVNPGVGLPPGAEISVRLIAPPSKDGPVRAGADFAVVNRSASPADLERVLGEHTQTLAVGTAEPVPFRIPYHADDATLRRGLSVEARVSIGGKLRYRTIDAHMVTLTSSAYLQDVQVQPVQ